MKRDFPDMTCDLGHVKDRETFLFHERFDIPLQEGVEGTCDTRVRAEAVCRGSRIYLGVEIGARLEGLVCDRCLAGFSLPFETDVDLVFHRGERFQGTDGLEEDEFIRMPPAGEFSYDIFDRVKEALILEMPIKFLCRADCKGLCPECGINLNDGECGCEPEPVDERWAPLKKMLNRRDDS